MKGWLYESGDWMPWFALASAETRGKARLLIVQHYGHCEFSEALSDRITRVPALDGWAESRRG